MPGAPSRVRSVPRRVRGWLQRTAPPAIAAPLLLGTAWLALHVPGLVEGLRAQGLGALLALPGMTVLDLAALAAASAALLGHPAGIPASAAGPWAWLAAAVLLVPSANLAALVLLALGALLAWRGSGPARWGALGLAGLGLHFLWLRHGLAAQASIINWEAWAAHGLLAPFTPGLVLDGNVLRLPGGHGVAVLGPCSVAQSLPLAVLALLVPLAGQVPRHRLFAALTLAVPLLLLANVARLALLAASPAGYAWGHGALGANLYGLACLLLLQGCDAWARRA